VRLTVLGCSGTFPGPTSPCSGYLVEHDGFRVVVDLGAGALGALQKHVGLLDVDAVVISHLHADHCIDLVAYAYARRYHPAGVPPALPVLGPVGTCDRIAAAFEAPPEDGLLDVFAFADLGEAPVRLGPFTLTTAVVNHPVESRAVRLEAGGRTLVYSSDTGACEALVDLARGADLLLCEATWTWSPDNPPDVHLSGREAGEQAARAGVDRMVLTHVTPHADPQAVLAEALSTFPGALELARCDASWDV
jgi:ribonuclease BN (tRNA processing enzyme)